MRALWEEPSSVSPSRWGHVAGSENMGSFTETAGSVPLFGVAFPPIVSYVTISGLTYLAVPPHVYGLGTKGLQGPGPKPARRAQPV